MICPLCKKLKVRRLRVEKGVEIFECLNCQLGFVDPKKISIRRSSHRYNLDKLYNLNGYKKEEKKLRVRFDRLTSKIIKYKKSGRVLDIGAGFGLFSSILQKKGNFHFDLIEPTTMLQYNIKSKHRIFKGKFEEFFSIKKQRYDIILMMDVLEHFKNPLKNLKKAWSLLKTDGILVIQTPNYKSLMARICKDWAWWMIEEHKFFFSPKSLKLMLHKAGFKINYFMTYEDWQDFQKNLDGNFIGIKNKIIRKTLKSLFFLTFIPFYYVTRKILWKLNYGGLIFLLAKITRHRGLNFDSV